MASVSVVYIADDVVGPHLELIRNICEPASRSRPHVTVRFFDRLPVPDEYLNARVGYIDLIEPAAFALSPESRKGNRTVFIRCESDDLLHLEHKPDYPESEFHITAYDGTSKKFAAALLQLLREYTWKFRVILPPGTTLTGIQIKPRRSGRPLSPREYSPPLKRIFYAATSRHLAWEYLHRLTERERLDLVAALCDHLHQATVGLERIRSTERDGFKTERLNHRTGAQAGDATPEIHLTPPELAHGIAEYAVGLLNTRELPVHFGDPAVGTGAFYSALLRVLGREQIASAVGVDINRGQAEIARRRWAHRGMDVVLADYLHMERVSSPRTLILANPPYLRHQAIPTRYKTELCERSSLIAGMRVSALSGQYVYFLLLAHKWMAPNALAAWLIPSEFMRTSYGAVVRHYLTHHVELIRIHQFSHKHPQFEKAKVFPAVVVFRNRPPSGAESVLLTVGGSVKSPVISDVVKAAELRLERRWVIPRPTGGSRGEAGGRIGDLFDVRRGIATGANGFFILEREEAAGFGIPESACRPILPKARTLESDIVERESDGYPKLHPQLCVLDCDLPEATIRARYPGMARYLRGAKEQGLLDRNLVRKRRPWYKQERREPSAFVCTYMGRGRHGGPPIRFIWNKSDAIATNTYLLLYPRPRLKRLLHKFPGLDVELFSLLQEASRTSITERARLHAGGLYKIEPRELEDVPLQTVPPWWSDAIDSQLAIGGANDCASQRGEALTGSGGEPNV